MFVPAMPCVISRFKSSLVGLAPRGVDLNLKSAHSVIAGVGNLGRPDWTATIAGDTVAAGTQQSKQVRVPEHPPVRTPA